MRLLTHLFCWIYLAASLAGPGNLRCLPEAASTEMACGMEEGSCCASDEAEADSHPDSDAGLPAEGCCAPERACTQQCITGYVATAPSLRLQARQTQRRFSAYKPVPAPAYAPPALLALRASEPYRARAALPDGQGLFLRLGNLRT